MDALNAYASGDDDDSSSCEGKSSNPQPAVVATAAQRPGNLNAAPSVSLTAGRSSTNAMVAYNDSNSNSGPRANKPLAGDMLVLHNNPKKDVLYQPVQGPQAPDPSNKGGKNNNTATATIRSNVAVDETSFAAERANFQRAGRAAAPTATGETVVRSTPLGYSRDRLRQLAATEAQRRTKRPRVEEYSNSKSKNKQDESLLVQGSDDEAEYGVWGPPSAEEQLAVDQTVTSVQTGDLAPEQLAERAYFAERDRQRGMAADTATEESAQDRLVERKMAHLLPPRLAADETPVDAASQFYGTEEFDYKGQSWTAPPAGLGGVRADGEAAAHRCFVPKQCVHRVTAPTSNNNNNSKTKGVHRIRLFPVTGHLLLSAGLDGTCHVWKTTTATTTADQQKPTLMRTYTGHRAAVRDVQFNHDGGKFVSASFDRYLRLWDTASGQVLQTFTNRKVPYVVQFYPHDDNFFCVGCSDNKIVTYNATTAEITQEYNHHLAPVNAILFVEDNGTKMITSSDDKKVLVWEWDIGVPIKYISDPTMHSMPCLVLHPSLRFFVGQSLDNTIAVFQASNKFALQKKKTFSGHVVSGYACEPAFSPDGQFLVSGDGNGALFVWDWKKHKILQKFRAHAAGPTACCAWHPLEPSVLFSCGWDGTIKVWK